MTRFGDDNISSIGRPVDGDLYRAACRVGWSLAEVARRLDVPEKAVWLWATTEPRAMPATVVPWLEWIARVVEAAGLPDHWAATNPRRRRDFQ